MDAEVLQSTYLLPCVSFWHCSLSATQRLFSSYTEHVRLGGIPEGALKTPRLSSALT